MSDRYAYSLLIPKKLPSAVRVACGGRPIAPILVVTEPDKKHTR